MERESSSFAKLTSDFRTAARPNTGARQLRENAVVINVDPAPLVKEMASAAYAMVPSARNLNPVELWTKAAPSFAKLLTMAAPFMENKDVLVEVVRFVLADSQAKYANSIPVLRQLILSDIFFNPAYLDYIYMFLDSLGESIDPEIRTKILNDPKFGALLNAFRYQPTTTKLLTKTGLPDATAFLVSVGLEAINSQVPGAVPLKDENGGLKLLPAAPAEPIAWISLQNAFLDGCFAGKLDYARDFRKQHPTAVNRQGSEDMSPLFSAAVGHIAGMRDADRVFTYLLEHEADPDFISIKKGGSVADYIRTGLQNKGKDLVRFQQLNSLLEQRQAFIKAWKQWIAGGRKKEETPKFNVPVDKILSFNQYIKTLNVQGIIDLLDQYPRLKYVVDQNGMTILHRTAYVGLSGFITQLQRQQVQEVAADGEGKSEKERVPTYMSAFNEDSSEKGKGKAPLAADEAGMNALAQDPAAIVKSSAIWSYLMDCGVPFEVKDKDGKTAEDYFIEVQQKQKKLFEQNAQAQLASDFLGYTESSEMKFAYARMTDAEKAELKELYAQKFRGRGFQVHPLLRSYFLVLTIAKRARAIHERNRAANVKLLQQAQSDKPLQIEQKKLF